MFVVRNVKFGVNRKLYEKLLVPTLTYGAVASGMRLDGRPKMCKATRRQIWRSEIVRRRVVVR